MQKIVDKLQSAQVIVVDEIAFGKLIGKVDSQGEKLDSLNKAVFGNGREGLIQTSTRIEERLGLMDERLDGLEGHISTVDGKIDGLDTKLDTITFLLQKHVDDQNLHSLKGFIWNRKTLVDIIIAFVVGFLLLHAILPPELTVWGVIRAWLGI